MVASNSVLKIGSISRRKEKQNKTKQNKQTKTNKQTDIFLHIFAKPVEPTFKSTAKFVSRGYFFRMMLLFSSIVFEEYKSLHFVEKMNSKTFPVL